MFNFIEDSGKLSNEELLKQSEELWSNIGTPLGDMYASSQFDYIKQIIEEYEKKVSDDSNVAILLTNFGQQILMQVTTISYRNPVLMVFEGLVNGEKSILIQHVNQLNFLLTTTPRLPNKPKQKIGFQTE